MLTSRPLAGAVATTLFLFAATMARAQEVAPKDPNRVPVLSSFGPVTLAGADGLRLCHANMFGDGSVRIAWVIYRLTGDGSVKPIWRKLVEVAAAGGACTDFNGLRSPNEEAASIIAVLVAARSNNWGSPATIVGTAQRVQFASDGSVRFGELLPAVQKVNVSWTLPVIADQK